ncbi:LLM class flavin-dependent oxidoreductase [Actinoallomurus acaciae]|uniref:LLM class flavin-dependent oxidoreductase n=1 Tax=Actinoallomurus acaciae TaxID=502577 RepID=A0ABV5Y6R2_9ACTN
MALLSAIVAGTRRITVMPSLLNLPLRPPARTAAGLDVLSDGRFELGLGAGTQQLWESILAEGGPAVGDGWISSSPFFPPEALPNADRIIDEAARTTGRSPRSIRRGYNIEGAFDAGSGFLQGPPAAWVQQLSELVLAGQIDTFFLYRADSPDFLRRFAAEVAPAVRELLARG